MQTLRVPSASPRGTSDLLSSNHLVVVGQSLLSQTSCHRSGQQLLHCARHQLHNTGQLVRKELKCFYLLSQICTLLVWASKQLTHGPNHTGTSQSCREAAALHHGPV